jgi:cyanophycinase
VLEGCCFEVIGAGAVYIVDGSGVTQSNIAEASPERTLSMHDVRLHVLSSGDTFHLERRHAVQPAAGQ